MITPLTLARLSAAAYEIEPHTASDNCNALGLDFLGLIGISDCQALIARNDCSTIVAIRGTQFGEHTSVAELWDDVNGMKIGLGSGSLVRAGFWHPLADLWPQLRQYIDPERKVIGTGHSLGAVRALLLAGLIPPWVSYEATVFAPPKGANAAFWKMVYANRKAPVIYGRAGDFALNWSPLDADCCLPSPVDRLDGGRDVVVAKWPVLDEGISAHAVDLYVNDLAALEAAKPAATA